MAVLGSDGEVTAARLVSVPRGGRAGDALMIVPARGLVKAAGLYPCRPDLDAEDGTYGDLPAVLAAPWPPYLSAVRQPARIWD